MVLYVLYVTTRGVWNSVPRELVAVAAATGRCMRCSRVHAGVAAREKPPMLCFLILSSPSLEYFMNFQQRRLSTLILFLTDARNRPLGRLPGSSAGTAASSQTAGVLNSSLQSTQGNLFFTATIRIDVVQVSFPNMLQAPPIPPPQPALHNRGTLVWQDHGASKFDSS